VWGLRLLVSPLKNVTIYAIATLIVAAAARVFFRLFPRFGHAASTAGAVFLRFLERHELHDPSLLLQIIAGAGALAFAALVLYRQPDATIFAMYINDAPAERLAALQPSNEPHYDVFARLLELVLFAYGLAAYVVYSHARRGSVRIPSVSTAYVLVVPAVALLVMRAMPYRVVYQNAFERVDYGNTRCYAIGQQPGMIRLFCPDENPPRNRDYAVTDPALHDRHITESVFTPRDQAQVFATTSP